LSPIKIIFFSKTPFIPHKGGNNKKRKTFNKRRYLSKVIGISFVLLLFVKAGRGGFFK